MLRVSPGAQSGNCGSLWRQGHAAFPQARTHGFQAVMSHRVPSELRQAAYGCSKILLSFVRDSKPEAALSITQSCTTRPDSGAFVPFVIHNLMRTLSLVGVTLAPKDTPSGNVRWIERAPEGSRVHSRGSSASPRLSQIVGTWVWAR